MGITNHLIAVGRLDWNRARIKEREGNSISGSPPPRLVVGTFRVTEKTETTVMLAGDNGVCKLVDLAEEDVAYFPMNEEFVGSFTHKKKE